MVRRSFEEWMKFTRRGRSELETGRIEWLGIGIFVILFQVKSYDVWILFGSMLSREIYGSEVLGRSRHQNLVSEGQANGLYMPIAWHVRLPLLKG